MSVCSRCGLICSWYLGVPYDEFVGFSTLCADDGNFGDGFVQVSGTLIVYAESRTMVRENITQLIYYWRYVRRGDGAHMQECVRECSSLGFIWGASVKI